jgi:protein-disulfide isomerase
MKIKPLFLGLALGFIGLSANAQSSFSPDQVKQIQNVVHDYLVKNPQVLVEVSQALQAKQMEKMQAFSLKAIADHKAQIFNDQNSPVAGNKNGDVVIVEFFDYQCSHCKDMKSVIDAVIKKNPDVKVIFKEFPIFGANSEFASKAALAANMQGKYFQLHEALLAQDNPLTKEKIMKVLQNLNLNAADIEKNMSAANIVQELKNNYDLAKKLKIMGTPAFIIANKDLTKFGYVPGATSAQDLQTQIDAVKSGKNGPASGDTE